MSCRNMPVFFHIYIFNTPGLVFGNAWHFKSIEILWVLSSTCITASQRYVDQQVFSLVCVFKTPIFSWFYFWGAFSCWTEKIVKTLRKREDQELRTHCSIYNLVLLIKNKQKPKPTKQKLPKGKVFQLTMSTIWKNIVSYILKHGCIGVISCVFKVPQKCFPKRVRSCAAINLVFWKTSVQLMWWELEFHICF